MNHTLRLSLLATLLAATCTAHAGDFVIGATASDTYRTSLLFNDAGTVRKVDSGAKPIPLKLYGGIDFDERFGIEAGYKDFGKSTVDPVRGSGNTLSSQAHATYIAGKATWHPTEAWSLFGKLGVADTRTHFDGAGTLKSLTTTAHRTGAYASVGAAYALTANLALTVEVEHFGKDSAADKHLAFNMNGVAAGLRFGF